jgi:hypothetical protein
MNHVYDFDDVASALGIEYDTLALLISHGHLTFVLVGRRSVISAESLAVLVHKAVLEFAEKDAGKPGQGPANCRAEVRHDQ